MWENDTETTDTTGYIDDLLESAFPSDPDKDGLCLTCRVAARRRHSWFCRKECELAFAKEHEVVE